MKHSVQARQITVESITNHCLHKAKLSNESAMERVLRNYTTTSVKQLFQFHICSLKEMSCVKMICELRREEDEELFKGGWSLSSLSCLFCLLPQ